MSSIKTFRDLIVWQRGMAIARAIYGATRAMPRSEAFGLTDQMRRAAVSIPSNIAEGYARRTRPEYLRSLRIASGSLAELATQYELAVSIKMLEPDPAIMGLLAEQDRLLESLCRKLRNKP